VVATRHVVVGVSARCQWLRVVVAMVVYKKQSKVRTSAYNHRSMIMMDERGGLSSELVELIQSVRSLQPAKRQQSDNPT
jgi:hypothetical protein